MIAIFYQILYYLTYVLVRKGRQVCQLVVWSKIEQTGMITRLTIIDKLVKVGERAILSTDAHKMRPTTVMN